MPNRDQNRAATIDSHQPNFREFFESRDVVAVEEGLELNSLLEKHLNQSKGSVMLRSAIAERCSQLVDLKSSRADGPGGA